MINFKPSTLDCLWFPEACSRITNGRDGDNLGSMDCQHYWQGIINYYCKRISSLIQFFLYSPIQSFSQHTLLENLLSDRYWDIKWILWPHLSFKDLKSVGKIRCNLTIWGVVREGCETMTVGDREARRTALCLGWESKWCLNQVAKKEWIVRWQAQGRRKQGRMRFSQEDQLEQRVKLRAHSQAYKLLHRNVA